MIQALLGRFFRHCIDAARRADAGKVRIDPVDFRFMTDQEISFFIHGDPNIDWDRIAERKRNGIRMDQPIPGPVAEALG